MTSCRTLQERFSAVSAEDDDAMLRAQEQQLLKDIEDPPSQYIEYVLSPIVINYGFDGSYLIID